MDKIWRFDGTLVDAGNTSDELVEAVMDEFLTNARFADEFRHRLALPVFIEGTGLTDRQAQVAFKEFVEQGGMETTLGRLFQLTTTP